jgi:hypothetical protein
MGAVILVVDTQIVMIGNGMGDRDPEPPHSQLLGSFEKKARLALDKLTEQEYLNNMAWGSQGRAWLDALSKTDRIDYYSKLPRVKKKTKVALNAIRFNKADWRFINLTLATPLRTLVAEEPHFVSVQAMLKRYEGITVHDAQSACDMIETNHADSAPAEPTDGE